MRLLEGVTKRISEDLENLMKEESVSSTRIPDLILRSLIYADALIEKSSEKKSLGGSESEEKSSSPFSKTQQLKRRNSGLIEAVIGFIRSVLMLADSASVTSTMLISTNSLQGMLKILAKTIASSDPSTLVKKSSISGGGEQPSIIECILRLKNLPSIAGVLPKLCGMLSAALID